MVRALIALGSTLLVAVGSAAGPANETIFQIHDVHFWWNWGSTVAVAIATLILAAVAVYGDAARRFFAQPDLHLKLVSEDGEKTHIKISSPQDSSGNVTARKAWARYYHLSVTNKRRRWAPATELQVFLVRLMTRAADGQWVTEWTGGVPMAWKHQAAFPVQRTVGPEAICDICTVIEGKGVAISPIIFPYNLPTRWTDLCSFRISLQARAIETDSKVVDFQIDWNGNWAHDDNEMRKNFVIKQVGGSE